MPDLCSPHHYPAMCQKYIPSWTKGVLLCDLPQFRMCNTYSCQYWSLLLQVGKSTKWVSWQVESILFVKQEFLGKWQVKSIFFFQIFVCKTIIDQEFLHNSSRSIESVNRFWETNKILQKITKSVQTLAAFSVPLTPWLQSHEIAGPRPSD